MVFPKGQKIKPTTISIPDYEISRNVETLALTLMRKASNMLDRYTRGAYTNIPLKLGWNFKPVWTSGPNTHYRPDKDCSDTVWKSFPKRTNLSIWQTLPLDAGAFVNNVLDRED